MGLVIGWPQGQRQKDSPGCLGTLAISSTKKERNTWGDKDFGGQVNMASQSQAGHSQYVFRSPEGDDIPANSWLFIIIMTTTQCSLHQKPRRGTMRHRCHITCPRSHSRGSFIHRHSSSRAHSRDRKFRTEMSQACRCNWKVIHTQTEGH